MKLRKLAAVVLAGGLLLAPTTSTAQQDGEVEQGLGKFLKKLGCKHLPDIVGLIPGVGTVAKAGAAMVCGSSGGQTIPSTNPESDGAVVEQLPALQAQIFKVVENAGGGDPNVTAATPDTNYAMGEGFAVVLTHNSSGYLEVWSVDATSTKMIEAMVLPNKAGIVALPKREVGFYRMTTAGGSDKIRIRFLPCTPSQQHAFEIAPNARAGALVGQEARSVDALAATLAPCPFEDNVNTAVANDDFFDGMTGIKPVFSAGLGAYTAVSKTNGPVQFDITLKRN